MVIVLVLIGCPPYVVVALVIVNNVLVLRRTTGKYASHYVNCAKLCLLTLVITGQTSLGLLFEQFLIGRIVCNHG